MAQLAIMAAVMAVQVGLQLLLAKKPKTPSQPELQPTSSIYGTPIKLTYASMMQGGTVVWQSRRRKKSKTVGKGGGGSTVVSYHQDFLISFGEAGRTIMAIFGDGKQEPIYDARAKKIKQKYKDSPIRIYEGGDAQLPDPLVEKDRGVGNCSANRRINSVMFENFPLDDWGGRIPNMRALVVENFASTTQTDPFITGFNGTGGSGGTNTIRRGSLMPDRRADHTNLVYAVSDSQYPDPASWLYKIDRNTEEITLQMQTGYMWGSLGLPDTDPQGFLYTAGVEAGALTYAKTVVGKFSCDTLTQIMIGTKTGGAPAYMISGGIRVNQYTNQLWCWESSDLNNAQVFCFDRDSMFMLWSIPREIIGALPGFYSGPNRLFDIDGDDQENAWVIFSGGGVAQLIKIDSGGNVSTALNLDTIIPGASIVRWIQEDNSVLLATANKMVKVDLTTDPLTVAATLDGLNFTENISSFHGQILDHTIWLGTVQLDTSLPDIPGTLKYIPVFTQIDVRTLTIVQSVPFPDAYTLYPPPGGNQFFNPTNALFDPNTRSIISEEMGEQSVGVFRFVVTPGCVSLQHVVEDLSIRTGRLSLNDVVAAPLGADEVCGYVREQRQPTRQDIEVLGQAYTFYGVEKDWRIHFNHFGGLPSIEIPEDDLGSFEGGGTRPNFTLEEDLIPDYERPKRVDVTYFDEDMNYQQNTQHWDLPARNVKSSDKQTFTLPLTFNRSFAKDVARRLLYQIRNEAIPYKFSLQPKYLYFNPGDDAILVMNSGARLPFKFIKIELGANYLLQCEGIQIDPPLYVPLYKGGPGGGPIPIEIGERPATDLVLLDIPSLRDVDAASAVAGPYLAVAPVNGDTDLWPGASILKSPDGGSSWNGVAVMTSASIIGWSL